MGLGERIVRALGGTPAADLPAVIDRALVPHREAIAAEMRSVTTTYGDAFARGIEDLLRGGLLGSLRKFGQPEYSNHALVYACMALIAESVAAVPFKLWKRLPDGTPGDLVTDHPLLERLANPFPERYPSGAYFIELLVLYGLAGGNAWVMPDETVTSKTRLPVSFTVLGGAHVFPRVDHSTWRLAAWELRWGPRPRLLAPELLDHFKLANPDDVAQIMGVGPLQAARRDVQADFARQTYDEQFFVNGAAPSLVMKYDGGVGPESQRKPLASDDLKAAVAAFSDKHAGAEKMQKVAGLNAGWSLERLGVTQKDMEFIEGFLHTTRRVGFVFRVPSVLLNDREQGGMSQEEIRAAEARLARAQTVPWCQRLSAFFQRIFVDRYAPGMIGGFDTDEIDALKVNFDKKVENYVRLVGAQISPKDANELVDLGLDPAKLSDEPLVPFSLAPLSEVMAGHALDVTPAPTALPPPTADAAPDDATPAPAPTPRVLLVPRAFVTPRRTLVDPAEARAALRLQRWRAFVAGLTPLERRFHREVRKYVFALRAETLGNLAATQRMRAVDDDLRAILFDERAADARLRTLATPFFREAVQIGATSAAADLAADPIGLDAPGMTEFLDLKQIKVVGINDTIREALRGTLREGLQGGEALNDLAGRVRRVFDASASRARTIARTEISSVVSGGRFLEMADQGVEAHEWLSARDEHVRDSHQAMDGEVVSIGQPFSAGILYPGDVNGPPEEIINCFPAGTIVRGEFLGGLRAPYAGPLVELRTRSGHRLRVTPNHPVLTPEGFVPAQSLRKGDHVLSQRVGVEAVMRSGAHRQGGSALTGHHHVDRGPAAVGEVLQALRQAGAHLRTKRPVALDLDGDGRFFHGDIEIVEVDGALVCDQQATGTEGRHEVGLVAAAAREAILARASHALPALTRHTLSARGGVRGEDAAPPSGRLGFRGRSLIRETSRGGEFDVASLDLDGGLVQAVRFGCGSEFNTSLYELPLQSRPGQSEVDGQSLHGRAGAVSAGEFVEVDRVVGHPGGGGVGAQHHARALQMARDRGDRSVLLARELLQRHALTIAADEIVEIHKDLPFVGHVYDLQASGGWMLADGIVASNCRCVAQPVNG